MSVSKLAKASAMPPDFLWGCATSAYQIEGSPLADGAGASFWQRFVRTPGRVIGGDTGDIACGHYERMKEDVAMMRDLGLTSYRFSIAWGRVLPEGRGRVNPAGLGFYERLVDELLKAGITPMATLYHWDLPEALDDRGGWLNPDVSDWFAEYTEVCVRALDDRVPLWVTLNEPWVVAHAGYMHGTLAPGHKSAFEAAIVAHRLMQAHAKSVQAFRASTKSQGRNKIGLVVNIEPKDLPKDASPGDRHARDLADAYMNRQYLDPALLGRYPDELREVFGEAWPDWPAAEVEALKQPIDFLGLNYYTRAVVRADAEGWPVKAKPERQRHATHTEMDWEVHAPSLTETLVWMHERYGGLPLYVTENGAAFYDPPKAIDGRVDDPLRINYLRTHITAVQDAIARGADIRGYYAWSLMDNLEWSLGFAKRFGLVHVDFETLERTPKASALDYSRIIASNGAHIFPQG
ncbi:MAG TPA: GH1 family beta-glucosidase [Burkholderiaceae bacterium]|jgi:beta-glucosidase